MTSMPQYAARDADAVEVPATTTYSTLPSGVFTVVGPSGHRSFEVTRQDDAADFAPGQRVISLLVGPDNGADWKGFGFVADDARRYPISVWKSLRGSIETPSEYERYAWMLIDLLIHGRRRLRGPSGVEHDYRIMMSRRCLRCDRRLTTPESLAAGIGPECAKKGVA